MGTRVRRLSMEPLISTSNDNGVESSDSNAIVAKRRSLFPPMTVTSLTPGVPGAWSWAFSSSSSATDGNGPNRSNGSAQLDGADEVSSSIQRGYAEPSSPSIKASMPEVYNTWMGWRTFLKLYWCDILALLGLGLFSLLVWLRSTLSDHLFTLYDADGTLMDSSIAYPIRPPILASWQAGLISSMVPLLVILLMQTWIASMTDFTMAGLGLGYSILQACSFQVVLKFLIGGIRPNFLEHCKPVLGQAVQGQGFGNAYHSASAVCTGDIKEALQSFPSGHTTSAFAGFVYLTLYMNAKWKIMSSHRPSLAVGLLATIWLCSAVLIAGCLTVDHWHHWYDILAGAIIGTLSALMAFRMVYASILDWRFNHIPLSPRYSFTYEPADPMVEHFRSAVCTNCGSWGPEVCPVDRLMNIRGRHRRDTEEANNASDHVGSSPSSRSRTGGVTINTHERDFATSGEAMEEQIADSQQTETDNGVGNTPKRLSHTASTQTAFKVRRGREATS